MKTMTIFEFSAYHRDQDEDDVYPEVVRVHATSQIEAEAYLTGNGFLGIEYQKSFNVYMAE